MNGFQLMVFIVLALIGSFSWGIFSYRRSGTSFLVILGSFLTVMVPLRASFGSVEISLIDIALVIYLVAITLKLIYSEAIIVLPFNRWYLAVIAVFVGILFFAPFVGMVVWNYSPTVLTAGIRYLEWSLFLPITVIVSQRDEQFEEKVLQVIMVSILFHGIAAILQISGFVRIAGEEAGYVAMSGRAVGLLPGPNQLGSYGAICLLIILSFWFYGRNRNPIVYSLAVVGAIIIIFLSESRTGLVMAMVPVVLLAGTVVWERGLTDKVNLHLIRNSLIVSFSLVIAAWALELVVGGITNKLGRFAELPLIVLSDPTEIDTLASRIEIWEEALVTYGQIGWHGSFVPAIFVTTPIHNYYLSMLVQAGPLGLAAWLALLIFSIRCGVRNFCAKRSPAAFALVFVTISIAIGSIMRHPIVDPPIQILFWTLIGLAPSAVVRERRQNRSQNPSHQPSESKPAQTN